MTVIQETEVTAAGLHGVMRGYVNASLLRAGLELGVFDAVHQGLQTSDKIAEHVVADPRGTRILLDALAATGLLRRRGADEYELAPGGETYLVSTSPQYFGGAVKIGVSKWEWDAQWRLAEAVRKGGAVMDTHALTPDFDYWEEFAEHMNWWQNGAANVMAEQLLPWAKDRDSVDVLDVACSHGSYGFFFARQEPRAKVTGLDWPHVLKYTERNAERLGLRERWDSIAGDMFEVPLEGPYDIVMLTNVLHHFSREESTELLRRMAEGLKPGGRIAITGHTFKDGVLPQDNPLPFMFSVIMLTMTFTGETHSISTYEEMLLDAGFINPTVHQDAKAMHTVFIAERA
ncbi:methyltransferase [Streptomyces sp. NPDC003032]